MFIRGTLLRQKFWLVGFDDDGIWVPSGRLFADDAGRRREPGTLVCWICFRTVADLCFLCDPLGGCYKTFLKNV